tara:strand:+ start:57 stop:206 length:150 start_codon:yes stop_codon:yes gene_type:complete
MNLAQEILNVSKCEDDVKFISEYHADRVSFHSDKTIYTFKDDSTIEVGE